MIKLNQVPPWRKRLWAGYAEDMRLSLKSELVQEVAVRCETCGLAFVAAYNESPPLVFKCPVTTCGHDCLRL